MKRGDIVTAVSKDPFWGGPRAALVVQADRFIGLRDSLTVCPITTTLIDAPLFRIRLEPNGTGLKTTSDVMFDKIQAIRADKVGPVIGRVTATALQAVDQALKRWQGLA